MSLRQRYACGCNAVCDESGHMTFCCASPCGKCLAILLATQKLPAFIVAMPWCTQLFLLENPRANFCALNPGTLCCTLYPAERILCEFFLLELRIPVRIPERILVRIFQVRCSLSWKVQMIMENPLQNSQQNPQQNSHGRMGDIFTDFFCRVGSITFGHLARACSEAIPRYLIEFETQAAVESAHTPAPAAVGAPPKQTSEA